jgi:hypothetical protein
VLRGPPALSAAEAVILKIKGNNAEINKKQLEHLNACIAEIFENV